MRILGTLLLLGPMSALLFPGPPGAERHTLPRFATLVCIPAPVHALPRLGTLSREAQP